MATKPSPLLAPSPRFSSWGTRSPGGSSIKDLLAERQRNSPIPPPSPAISESGFSAFIDDSPAMMHSPTFHFEAHHPFHDEPATPDLSRPSDEVDGTVVFDSNVVHSPPTSPLRPSTSGCDDGLSVQSLTITDGFSDCSPSPSIGSVRMAKITKIPRQGSSRLSMGTASVLSESVEDAPEDGDEPVWDVKALARTSYVDRLPRDLALILQENERAKAEVEAAVEAEPTPAKQSAPLPPARQPPPPPAKDESLGVPRSASKESELSSESWKAHLDDAVQQMATEHSDADALQRMKSILGPKTRIISDAPWSADEQPISARRSFDMLSHRSSASVDAKAVSKAAKERQKENVQPAKTSRTRSFSILTSRPRGSPLGESKEQEEALKGLGLGLGTNTSISGSESKRSLKSLLKASSALSESESFSDFMATTPPATVRATKHSSPAALPFPSRPASERTDSSSQVSKVPRASPPVVFEMVAPRTSSPLASPTSANPPKSAPATVTLFFEGQASAPSRSDSKASLTVQQPQRSNSSGTPTSTPGTPAALSSVVSPGSAPGSPSYFNAVPGSSRKGNDSPPSFSHKLISLEQARQIQENERAAAAARTRESTAESLPARRGVPAPASISTASPSAPIPAIAAPAPVRALKPKKSGFLKRMMGGDKYERTPEMPSAPLPDTFRPLVADESYRPSLSSSASIPTLSSTSPPTSLGRASGRKVAEQSGRVSFLPPPAADPKERINKGPVVPALSLRPISMAFSAGLPSDFLAASPAADGPPPSASSPALSATVAKPIPGSRAPSVSSPPALVAALTPGSLQSSTSTAATSLFDEISPPSGSTTPLTPAFLSSSLSSSSGLGDDGKSVSHERFTALQDDFLRAKRTWKRQQGELEAQIRALQIELEKPREESAALVASSQVPPKEGEACERCGVVVKAAVTPTSAVPVSVIARPRQIKGGAGNLFGSTVVA
ncbi:hypothetical protein JCM8097_002594 [Rhodosporidiobolus ruineniae]